MSNDGTIGPGSMPVPAFGPDPREPKPKPVQREWQEQKTDNAFLSKALPPDAYFTAIDHARKMTAAHGKMRKDRGIRAGLPDWLIVYRGITLWIERKAGTSLSDHQKLTREALLRNGHYWALARSTEEVEQACRSMGIPMRATLGEIRGRIAEQNARIKPARNQASAGEYQHVEQRNCPRCGGTGRREEGGDAHRSPGIVPCDHRVWIPATRGRKRSGGFGGGGDSKARVRKAAAIYARLLLG